MSVLEVSTTLPTENRDAFAAKEHSNGSRGIPVEYDSSLAAALIDNDVEALKAYINYVIEFLQNEMVSVRKVRVHVEEDTQQCKDIVCAVYVNTSAEDAMSFWQQLEADTSCWLDKQDTAIKGFVIDHVVTVVRW